MLGQEKKMGKEKYERRVRTLASQGENFVCRTIMLSWPCAGETGSALPCWEGVGGGTDTPQCGAHTPEKRACR